jgi:Ca-activated chloride channel family protein
MRTNCLIRPLSATAFVLALASLPLLAQQQSPPLRVDVGLVLLESTVWDSAGKTIDSLSKEDFVLLDNGTPQPIAHFSRDELPLAITLLVDVSESQRTVFEPLRTAAQKALQSLKPGDRVALFAFSGETKLVVPLTHDLSRIDSGIKKLTVGGGTLIHHAIYEAASYMWAQSPEERRIIILVSDDLAGSKAGQPSKDDVERILHQADVSLSNIVVEDPRGIISRLEEWDVPHLLDLVRQTGGVITHLKNVKDFPVAFDSMISLLKSRYTLGFYPKEAAGDTTFHKLDLRLQSTFGEKGKDYKVLSKDGYYPSPAR